MKNAVPHQGLSDGEVATSRREHGANVLMPVRGESLLVKFLAKFGDPLILILLAAGGLSVGIATYEFFALGESAAAFFEPAGIFAAVILATGLSFLFETKAKKAFDLLNQVNDDEPVKAVRSGTTRQIPKREVVVGDILLLSTGDEIPADGDLLEAASLEVDESSLTGEPTCSKTTDVRQFDPNATFPSNRVLRGTKVLEGHGVMRVSAVGDRTENGKVFVAAQIDSTVKTPLDEQLARLARVISRVSYALAGLVIAGRLVSFFGIHPLEVWRATSSAHLFAYLLQSLMLSVTLVVVSVPEGLPMAVTLSLACNMRRMFKAKFLVRKLHACETMGATTVICTDKTGTLTQNRMRVQEIRLAGADGADRLVREGIAVNSTADLAPDGAGSEDVVGNPTEGALLLWLRGQGIDYRAIRSTVRIEAELPFNAERKYMASVVRSAAMPGRRVLHVKGAPEIVMMLCADCAPGTNETTLREDLDDCQKRGLRTLGFACRTLEPGENPLSPEGVNARGLTFLGFAAIADPVRSDVLAAVADCLKAGIDVKIVTGDTPNTAREIARQIGLWTDQTPADALVTGPEFANFDERELDRRARRIRIIARARPLDKKRLVESLIRTGEVVAVTGDGTNDAPALKAAHVGLSMGSGTSVAKEASDVTILDDSFASIVRAVMWGRSLYRNIQRFILFQMTVNVVACLTVLFGAFFGAKSPLSVTQMLWVNLIMDTFAAMAMSSLPPCEKVMQERPRPRRAFIITRRMTADLVLSGAFFTAILVAALVLFGRFEIGGLLDFGSAVGAAKTESGLNDYELSLFFTAFVLLQFWNIFRVRALGDGGGLSKCRVFLLVTLLILAGQFLLVTFGGRLFDVVPLRPTDWIVLLAATAAVIGLDGIASRLVARL